MQFFQKQRRFALSLVKTLSELVARWSKYILCWHPPCRLRQLPILIHG